jgi:hypothetical protein
VTTARAVPQLTILVPTRNGAKSVEPLLRRLPANVEPGTVVLFVDDLRLSLPPKLPLRATVAASLEPMWSREDLPVKLLTTRNAKFLVDGGVPR